MGEDASDLQLTERPLGTGDHRAEIRLWLRLLACTTLISGELRRRFRDEFDITIPRFEILAQLDREPSGLVQGELSKRLLVSPANVTPIIERLIQDGFVTRTASVLDRRIQIVCLTVDGRRKFRRMAKKHGIWLAALFDGYGHDIETLNERLGDLKRAVTRRQPRKRPAPDDMPDAVSGDAASEADPANRAADQSTDQLADAAEEF